MDDNPRTITYMAGDLYYGDNLDLLRNAISTESVDLVYLDPPFNSDRSYDLVHRESKAKERAFTDTWQWDAAAQRSYAELTGSGLGSCRQSARLSSLMRALSDFLGPERRDTLAYLSMMAIRLVELRRVLRATGSLYLHCDPTASHYLKLVLDAVFGADCFRNEIIWRYRRWPAKARRFQRMHDVLLFYTARSGNEHAFHPLYGYEKLADSTLKTFGTRRQRADFASGHRKPGVEAGESAGPPLSDFWEVEEVEVNGLPLSDAWEVGVIAPIGKERTGFPTQKPEKLLERVVRASSRENDVVLDPFCGCGTTLVVAEKQKRRWIGMDVAIRAIDMAKGRLDKAFPDRRVWTEHGLPHGVESAARLAERNAYDFQWWAVRMLGGCPPTRETKKDVRGRMDGEVMLSEVNSEARRRVILSVAGGKTLTSDMVEGLKDTVEREKADYGVLVSMHEPPAGLQSAARDCGRVPWASHRDGKLGQRIRIVTVREILAGAVRFRERSLGPDPGDGARFQTARCEASASEAWAGAEGAAAGAQ